MQDQRTNDKEYLLMEIQRKFASVKWVYTKHAVGESAIERGIWSYEVEEAIGRGKIIEDYPTDKYGPSCLILGWEKKRPLHIQVSCPRSEEKIEVITLYELDLEEWKEGFREREE
jgi:hypothetical protein